jgi:hypothetical protein
MCIAYLTQALDKGTLGTSSIMGWQKDVGAVGQGKRIHSMWVVNIDVGRLRPDQYDALDWYYHWRTYCEFNDLLC